MSKLALHHPTRLLQGQVPLESSKSESNRALIIQALAQGGIELEHLSAARDTQTLIRLLKSKEEVLDVLDAGTTMRFLVAYCAATGRKAVLTGTPRMQQRPIAILAEALRKLGTRIAYLGKEGYPPLRIEGFEQTCREVSVRGDVSSQYISALLMAGPYMPQGLRLTLEGEVASKPYIDMTLQLMGRFGVHGRWEGQTIDLPAQRYQPGAYAVESDWSGASYWYSMVALTRQAEVKLLGLREDSLQGDKAIVEIMERLGVASVFDADGVRLQKVARASRLDYDFSHCPDLAQTVAVLCAALELPARLTGLKSLRIKETDRIAALQAELAKFGVEVTVEGDDAMQLPGTPIRPARQPICTYDDHRMAMAFAPLALLYTIELEEPEVVAKSYPTFWDHLRLMGFNLGDSAYELFQLPKKFPYEL